MLNKNVYIVCQVNNDVCKSFNTPEDNLLMICCSVNYAVHLRTKINVKIIFEFQKQDYRRRNHNKQSRNTSISGLETNGSRLATD